MPRDAIGHTEQAAMWELLNEHFEGVSYASFISDLDQKNWALLIDDGGRLVAFSTMCFRRTRVMARTVHVVYSGDTISAPTVRASSVLARGWIGAVNVLRARHRCTQLYWLLLVSGFRTYRFLPVFWKDFFPRHDRDTPADTQRLRDELAQQMYGDRFDPAQGIVRFREPQRLRGAPHNIPLARLDDPHVCYFDHANPGHTDGDELVCLAELKPTNLTHAGWRMWNAGGRTLLCG